jgi:alanine-glyoxylate transaminase/serine-glyoxylate transaminase/serine-pyruvate transaminase
VRRAVGAWAEGQVIGFNIIDASERCNTVTPVLTNGHDPDALRAYCDEKCGVILGHGIGELSGKAFRIAHMGHVNAPMVLGTLSVIEMALAALRIPHGRGGAQAAIDWLGQQVKA